MALIPPSPLCVVSADAGLRRALAEVLAGQGHQVSQLARLDDLLHPATGRLAAVVVDPHLPGLGADPIGRLRAIPTLHSRPVLLLRDAEIAALRSNTPPPALISLVLRIHSQVAGDAQLDLLKDVSGLLTAAPDLDSTERNILEAVTGLVSADTATLFLLAEDGRLEARAALGYDLGLASLRRVDVGDGVVGWVVAQRTPTIVGDSDLDGRFTRVEGRSKRSMLAVPILLGHRVLGAITLVRRAPAEQFTDADLVLVGTIGSSVGIALESARIHDQERAVSQRLAEVEVLLRQERAFLDKLEEYDRLYTQVVATVSHELKTPLMGIRGFASMIRDGGLEPDETQEFAGEIHDNAVRLTRYVEGILAEDAVHSGRITVDLRPVELLPLVTQALRALPPAMTEGHRLAVDVAPGTPPVQGDPDQLLQVVTNLVSNAIKYSPNGGEVRIATRGVGASVELSVEDQGMGIPEDVRGRIFERFYRVPGAATRAIGGTGLGLSIVHGLVELHGGTIAVTAGRAGRGSCFVVTLPAAVEIALAVVADAPAVLPDAGFSDAGDAESVLALELAPLDALLIGQRGNGAAADHSALHGAVTDGTAPTPRATRIPADTMPRLRGRTRSRTALARLAEATPAPPVHDNPVAEVR